VAELSTSDESGAGGSQWYGDQAQWYPETGVVSPAPATPPPPADEEPTEEPSEVPAEEPLEEPSEDPGEEPGEEPAEEPSAELTEEPGEEPIEEPAELVEEAVEEPETSDDPDTTIIDTDKRAKLAKKAAVKVTTARAKDTVQDPGLPAVAESPAEPPPAVPAQRRTPEAKPDTAKPDTAKPDTARPDTARPETAKPGKAKRDKAKPGPEAGAFPVTGTAEADTTIADQGERTVRDDEHGFANAWFAPAVAGTAAEAEDDWRPWTTTPAETAEAAPAPPEAGGFYQQGPAREMPQAPAWQEQQPYGPGPGNWAPPHPATPRAPTGLWHRLHLPIGVFLLAYGLTNLLGTVLRWSHHRTDLAGLLDATIGGGGGAGPILIVLHLVEVLLTVVAGAGLLRRRSVWYLPALLGWMAGFGAFTVLDLWAGEFGRLVEHAAYFGGFTLLLVLSYALGVKAAVGRRTPPPAGSAPDNGQQLTRTQELALAAISNWQRHLPHGQGPRG
jgi:hypothetical protein